MVIVQDSKKGFIRGVLGACVGGTYSITPVDDKGKYGEEVSGLECSNLVDLRVPLYS